MCCIKGELEYQIPIDYSKLSTEELENKAGFYYGLALKTSNGKVNEDMTSALNLYAILSNKNPENTFYKIRLGHLYDIIGKDRYAKGYFFQAIGTDAAAGAVFQTGRILLQKRTLQKGFEYV